MAKIVLAIILLIGAIVINIAQVDSLTSFRHHGGGGGVGGGGHGCNCPENKFNVYQLFIRHQLPVLAQKYHDQFDQLSQLLNKLFSDLGQANLDKDLGFILQDDLGNGLISSLTRCMRAYQAILATKNKQLSDLIGLAAGLLDTISREIHQTFESLTSGKQRSGTPIFTRQLGDLLVRLSTSIAGDLSANDLPKFQQLLPDFFGRIGRNFDCVVQEQAKRLAKNKIPEDLKKINEFLQKFNDLIKKIINGFNGESKQQ
ncbi:uncharacterized protein LOC128953184 [Oppia nitens]|uniref:uncharacterized protein LOC128953184 n=1 Tax=Oppia nitens TaxID=1686743 RepID=UPI0023D9C133|nr:uncharacterized protein LOC128953184 [Oppia nitens]